MVAVALLLCTGLLQFGLCCAGDVQAACTRGPSRPPADLAGGALSLAGEKGRRAPRRCLRQLSGERPSSSMGREADARVEKLCLCPVVVLLSSMPENGDRKSPQMCSGLTPTPQKNRAPIRRLNWESRRASGNRAVGRSSRKQVSSADANSTAAVCPAPCGTQMAVAMCPGGTDPGRRVQALLPHARCARRHCDPAETAQGRHVKQLRST